MNTPPDIHPRRALFDSDSTTAELPVCDHYCGVEARMHKSLDLQAELGPVFDITLDCEDGAPVGGEAEHAHLVAEIVTSAANRFGRVGARVHPYGHAAFEGDVHTLIQRAGARLAYLMVPKPQNAIDVQRACDHIDHELRTHGMSTALPIHVLIETHGALREVQTIAAHPRVQSLSFGLMDFVSEHRGAIPAVAMGTTGAINQFTHPLVLRAKLEISAACHAFGKTPSHCVVTEFKNQHAISEAAEQDHSGGPGSQLGADPIPRHLARPCQLSVFLAGAFACSPNGPTVAGGSPSGILFGSNRFHRTNIDAVCFIFAGLPDFASKTSTRQFVHLHLGLRS